MKYEKKTILDAPLEGKKVLLRCDFNAPQDERTREITSDTRIAECLPTIRYLLEKGAAVIICAHLGKPKGQVKPELSLRPVAKRLAELMEMGIIFAADVVGPDAKAKAAALKPGQILLLENIRFESGEEKNDETFARELASMADIFVSDAFGAAHRAHASTVGVAAFLPAYAGFLIGKELSVLGEALTNPRRPFVTILGGAKVSDKIGVIENLLDKADAILVGGGMACTFIKALGGEIGNSLLEADKLELALSTVEKAKAAGVKFMLPTDNLIGDAFKTGCNVKTVPADKIPEGWIGMDIGPETVDAFAEAIKGAGTIIWNGPMGVFEFPDFAEGTNAIAHVLADSDAVTIVGGGDSVAAVEQLGYADRISHISTGGGASLNFLEGRELPGITCLMDKTGG